MQKIRLFITTLLVIFPMAAFSQIINPENQPIYQQARSSLAGMVNTPVIQHAFAEVQANHLRTNLDLLTGNFLDSQPLLQAMTPLFKKEMDEQVREGIQDGSIKMFLLERSSNYFHNDILDVAQAAIRASGRSEEEVQKAKIYLTDGPMNAYTISGRDGEQVIVIDTGLIDKLTSIETYKTKDKDGHDIWLQRPRIKKDELQPVLEHENGHKLFGHIDIGIKITALVQLLFKTYVTQGDKIDLSDIGDLTMLPDHHFVSGASGFNKLYRSAHSQAVKFATDTIGEMASHQKGGINQLLQDFVEHMISVVTYDGEMNKDVMTYLTALRHVAPGSLSKDDFEDKMGQVLKLISRNEETSADQSAHNGSTRAYIEAMFPKFNGAMMMTHPLDQDKYRQEILDGNEALIQANVRLYNDTSQAERERLLGTAGGDHPTSPTRAENIRRYGRTLDSEAMQNPILRLVVLHGGLVAQEENSALYVNLIKASMSELQASDSKLSPKAKKILEYLKKMQEQQFYLAVTSGDQAKRVLFEIIRLIDSVGYSGHTFASNHAFTDILDFVLQTKIRSLVSITEIKKKILTVDFSEKQVLRKKLTQYQSQLSAGDDILKALRSAVHKGSQASNIFTPKIQQILDKQLTVAKARKIRTELANALGEVDTWDRHWFYTEVGKEDRDIRGASVKDDQEDMRKALAQRQYELNELNYRSRPQDAISNPSSPLDLSATLSPKLEVCRNKVSTLRSKRVTKSP